MNKKRLRVFKRAEKRKISTPVTGKNAQVKSVSKTSGRSFLIKATKSCLLLSTLNYSLKMMKIAIILFLAAAILSVTADFAKRKEKMCSDDATKNAKIEAFMDCKIKNTPVSWKSKMFAMF